MKKLFKWILRLICLLVIVLVVLIVFRDTIARALAERQIRAETGMSVKIGKIEVGLMSPVITVQNLKLYNTAEFGGSLFFHVPELHMEYDPGVLGWRKLHLQLIRLNLAEINVVRSETGKTNVVSVMNRIQARSEANEKKKAKGKLIFEFTGIDTLNLTLGKAKYTDLQAPTNNREITIGLKDEVIKNLKSEKDFCGAVLLVLFRNGATFVGQPTAAAKDLLNSSTGVGENSAGKALDVPPAQTNKK